MAWFVAMEGVVAACLGNAAVGFLAQTVFGFNLAKQGEAGPEEHNAEALGKAGVELKVASCFQGFSFFFFVVFTISSDLLFFVSTIRKRDHTACHIIWKHLEMQMIITEMQAFPV